MKQIKLGSRCMAMGLRSLIFFASLVVVSTSHASIINADFSNGVDGLDNWLGDIVVYVDPTTETYDDGDITASYPDLFSTSAGTATIETGLVAAGEAYVVTLFQDFVLDPIAIGASLLFSVDLVANADDFEAVLINLDTGEIKTLISGVEHNITSWVGANVGLEFTVFDIDTQLGDSLQISNILFNEQVSVPEPPLFLTVLLFALFLIRNPQLTK